MPVFAVDGGKPDEAGNIAHPSFDDLKRGTRCETAWTNRQTGIKTWSNGVVVSRNPDDVLLWYPDTQEEESLRRDDFVPTSVRNAYLPALDAPHQGVAKIAGGILNDCILNSPPGRTKYSAPPKVTADEWVRKVNVALQSGGHQPQYTRDKLNHWLKNQSYRDSIRKRGGEKPPSWRTRGSSGEGSKLYAGDSSLNPDGSPKKRKKVGDDHICE